jgi:uncharacterized phiE125 gp8 family phage protein
MMLAPVRTAAPSTTPVSDTEAKAHLRVSHTAENALITIYIDAATARLDGWTGILGRCMVTQTWRQDYGGFCEDMRLPFPDVSAISSVTYFDEANASQTLASSNYELVNRRDGARLLLAEGGSYPSTYDRADAVKVTFVAGFGNAAAVPAALKAAMLLHIGVMFEGRSEGDLPPAYDALVAPYRRVGV